MLLDDGCCRRGCYDDLNTRFHVLSAWYIFLEYFFRDGRRRLERLLSQNTYAQGVSRRNRRLGFGTPPSPLYIYFWLFLVHVLSKASVYTKRRQKRLAYWADGWLGGDSIGRNWIVWVGSLAGQVDL